MVGTEFSNYIEVKPSFKKNTVILYQNKDLKSRLCASSAEYALMFVTHTFLVFVILFLSILLLSNSNPNQSAAIYFCSSSGHDFFNLVTIATMKL